MTEPTAPATNQAAMEPLRKIDGKFSMKYGVSGGQIVNTVSGEVIPEDEPLFLIRGRDNNAIAGITSYLNICKKRGCNELHLAGIDQTLGKFRQFAAEHPERMKQPGITRHLKLEGAAAPVRSEEPTAPATDLSAKQLAEQIESREVYEAAQAYRYAPITDQAAVVAAYNNMKAVIARAALSRGPLPQQSLEWTDEEINSFHELSSTPQSEPPERLVKLFAGRGESAESEQNKAVAASSGTALPAPPLSNERPAIQSSAGSLPQPLPQRDWEGWRQALLNAWAKDLRATMTVLLESGPAAPPLPQPERTSKSGPCPCMVTTSGYVYRAHIPNCPNAAAPERKENE